MFVIESRARADGTTASQRFADAMDGDVHTEFARLGELLPG